MTMSANCPICNFPMLVSRNTTVTRCASCGTQLQAIAQDDVTIPDRPFFFGLGLVLGMIFGPVIIATTEEGRRSLERVARAKVGG